MVAEPEWFFSTLAQATAASIGFVIAFTISIYTTKKSEYNQGKNEFQDAVDELRRKYRPVLIELEEALETQCEFEADSDMAVEFMNAHPHALRGWLDDQEDQVAAILWGQIYALRARLEISSQQQEDELIVGTFNQIRKHLDEIEYILSEDNGARHRIERSLDHESGRTGTINSMRDILDEDYKTTGAGARQLSGWRRFFEIFYEDYFQTSYTTSREFVGYDFNRTVSVVRQCFFLFLTGVIIPMMLLLSVDVSENSLLGQTIPDFFFTSDGVVALQGTLLLIIFIQSYFLFEVLIGFIEE